MSPPAKRGVLVAVVGLTPQVVTEALYGLTQARPRSSPISEVYVLTTATGKRGLMASLLHRERGQFFAFCREYDIEPRSIRFTEDTIHVITDQAGRELDDIRTEQDHYRMAEQVLSIVRTLTAREDTVLYGSLAGGRKTMSYLLGYVFSLFGRPGDRLFHVLVHPPELERHEAFYFKPKKNRVLRIHGKAVHTKDARIELAEVPYIRIRHKLSHFFGSSALAFREMVQQAQKAIDVLPTLPDLTVDLLHRRLLIGDIPILLTPKQTALYACFAESRAGVDVKSLPDLWPRIRALWQEAGGRAVEDATRRPAGDDFRPDIARINKAIRQALADPALSPHYMILQESERRQWGGRYGVRLAKTKITFRPHRAQ